MLYFFEVIGSIIFSRMMLILLEYPETISAEVRARTTVPFLVLGRAELSTAIQVFGTLTENPSPLKTVASKEVSVAPQELRSKRQEKKIILFIQEKVRKYGLQDGYSG